MRKLRVGVIGCGDIAKKRHIPYYLQNRKVELVAVCDINRSALECFDIKTYIDYRDMLSKEMLDLVDICTPPSGHVEQSIDCIEAGCDILVEKPFTYTVDECDKVLEVARKNNKEVCVAHSSLFFPSMMRMQEIVGELGEIEVIRMQYDVPLEKHVFCNDWIVKMPAGALHEQMPHVSYLIRKFIKPESVVVSANKVGQNSLPYDHYCIILQEGGRVCNVDIHYGKNWKVELVLVGRKKHMYVDLLNQYVSVASFSDGNGILEILKVWSKQILKRFLSLPRNFYSYFKPFGHKYIINAYVDHLLGNGPAPITMDEVRENVRITELVTKSIE